MLSFWRYLVCFGIIMLVAKLVLLVVEDVLHGEEKKDKPGVQV